MISTKEIASIDKSYFNVLQASSFAIYLQSKNTKHFWGLLVEEYPSFRHFKVYHKHKESDQYHQHRDCGNIKAAIKEIMNHDRIQMNGRKNS